LQGSDEAQHGDDEQCHTDDGQRLGRRRTIEQDGNRFGGLPGDAVAGQKRLSVRSLEGYGGEGGDHDQHRDQGHEYLGGQGECAVVPADRHHPLRHAQDK
jgi:hypothetical protein